MPDHVIPISEDVRDRFRGDLVLLVEELKEYAARFDVELLSPTVQVDDPPSDWGIVTFEYRDWIPPVATPSYDGRGQRHSVTTMSTIEPAVFVAATRMFLREHDWPNYTRMDTMYLPEVLRRKVWLRCHPHGMRGMPIRFPDDFTEEEIAMELERLARFQVELEPHPDFKVIIFGLPTKESA